MANKIDMKTNENPLAHTSICLDNIGKRFRYEWIFRHVITTFHGGYSYAILGPNGVGKSTLMKILSGQLTPSDGKITFTFNNKICDIDNVYRHISFAAPYIELIEEFTLLELLELHVKFKPFAQNLTINDVIDLLDFQKSKDKEIRYFSSGMRQRLKLALAICSQTPVLFLDEPTTNLDSQGIQWYRALMNRFALNINENTEGSQKLVIIASNTEHDYDFCNEILDMRQFK